MLGFARVSHNKRQRVSPRRQTLPQPAGFVLVVSSGKLYLNNLVNMPVFIHYFIPHHDQASQFNEANRYFCSDCLPPSKY